MNKTERKTKVRHTKEFTFDAILVYSPEKELKVLADLARTHEKLDWKPAIILSATWLEKFGIQKLEEYFEGKKTKLKKKLKRLSLPQVAILLYGLELIDKENFDWMNQIWRERITIVHPKGTPSTLPLYIGKEANKKYGEMVEYALEMIEFLKKNKKG